MLSSLPETVLAVGDPWHDSAYAVFDDGILRHVEVERLTRRKYEPLDSIVAACLYEPEVVRKAEMLLVEEGRTYAPLLRSILNGEAFEPRTEAERLLAPQIPLLPANARCEASRLLSELEQLLKRLQQGCLPFAIGNHHYSHAVNAFLSSGRSSGLVVTLDGGGTHLLDGVQIEVHGSVYRFDRQAEIQDRPQELVTEWSPGAAWTRACEHVGLTSNDAGTFMAMAAYGRHDPLFAGLVRRQQFWETLQAKRSLLRQKEAGLTRRILQWRLKDEVERFAFARALQSETERRIRRYLAPWVEGEQEIDLCLAGGTFLNCIAAQKLREWFPQVRSLYIPPVPYDAGICLGLLQEHLFNSGRDPGPSSTFMPFAYPPQYSADDVLQACVASGLAPPVSAGPDDIAEILDKGDIVGLFQDSSESGRRALGNRSILCDPRAAKNRDLLNERVKRRQWFRPFAPMVLAEHVQEWFDVEPGFASPYMSFAARFRGGKGSQVPAVRHFDNTARLQTVHRELTPGTHALLSSWYQRTGIPILLNTSFNEHEPIVETPGQAIDTMRRAGLSGIYFGDHGLFLGNKHIID